MEIQDFIIGFIMFALATSIILGAAYEIYSDNGLNITMDNTTAEMFQDFESESDESYDSMVSTTEDIRVKSPHGTDVGQDTLESDDDWGFKSGIDALSSIPASMSAANNLVGVTQTHFRKYLDPRFLAAFTAFLVLAISMLLLSVWLRRKI